MGSSAAPTSSLRRAIGVAILAVALVPTAASADPAAQRIVSMNVCTDQLIMLLADRDRIASVSDLASDPATSAMADIAAGIHHNHGLAEEIIPLQPDLVLAGTFTTRPTVFLLQELGFRVVEIPIASSLDDVRANVRAVAEAVGEPERGEHLVAAYDRRLSRATGGLPRRRPLAALYWANGYTSGSGTLANAVVDAAGYRTLATELGLTGTVLLPLEHLLTADTDLLITGRVRDQPALANETPRHPALERAYEGKPTVSVPDNLWVCGTPFVAEAVERLSAARPDLDGVTLGDGD